MIITSIQQAKKNENKVNLYLDGEFWVGIFKYDLLDLKLFKDKEITEEEKKKIEEISQITKVRSKIIEYIGMRPHSKKEIYDHFAQKHFIEKETLSNALDILEKEGVISDLDFTKWYLESRLASGKHGINKIKAELMQKGVLNKFIEIAIFEKSNTEDFQEKIVEQIKIYIEKVKKSIKTKDDREFKNKLIQRLMGRGFKYDDIKKAIKVDDSFEE